MYEYSTWQWVPCFKRSWWVGTSFHVPAVSAKQSRLLSWSETTLNYWVMVERYPNLKEEVGGSIPGCEISSLLDRNLALACWHSVSKKKKKEEESRLYRYWQSFGRYCEHPSRKGEHFHVECKLRGRGVGASTVKWTTPNPCIVLCESDSSLCTNIEFYEENIIDILRTFSSTKSSNLWWKNLQEKSTDFERRCKWCASMWYWTSDCLKFV